jgi:hypothetical protein
VSPPQRLHDTASGKIGRQLRSTDGGAHWTDIAPEQAWGGSLIEPRLMLDPNNPKRLFLDGGVKDRRRRGGRDDAAADRPVAIRRVPALGVGIPRS